MKKITYLFINKIHKTIGLIKEETAYKDIDEKPKNRKKGRKKY